MSTVYRIGIAGAVLVATALCGADLRAAPFRPATDDVVVQRLPAAMSSRTRRAQPPVDGAEFHRVRELIGHARDTGDPRSLGRAEALLRAAPPVMAQSIEGLLLQATIDQSLHRFEPALRRLDEVLRRQPLHAQARLTRATVLQVRGRFEEAARDCAWLERSAPPLVATTCSASVASLQGQGAAAYRSLEQALRTHVLEPATVVAWSRTVLAGIAERAGQPRLAARHYLAALALDPDDAFARAAFADLLLDAGDAQRALQVSAARRDHDALLLREALALDRLADSRRTAAVRELAERFALAHRRGETLHLREEARFELQLRGNAALALDLARRNWRVQREPADARILLEAARAAGDREHEVIARRWLREAGIVSNDTSARVSRSIVRAAGTRS
jgi:tetratricopeptide (TPR) repeat protein